MTLEEKIARVIAERDYARDRRDAGNPLPNGETLWDQAPQAVGEYWAEALDDTRELTHTILSLLPNRERERVLQEFEKHPALAAYIERIANAPLGWPHADWCDFLNKLNEALLADHNRAGEREKALEVFEKSIDACNGEQPHFEKWARDNRYDIDNQHPLHYIFMDKRTDAARMGWNAALAYVRGQYAALKSTPAPVGEDVDERAKKEILHAINMHKTIVCLEDTLRDQSNEALARSVYRYLASANLLRKE